jgi:hypothetical protein
MTPPQPPPPSTLLKISTPFDATGTAHSDQLKFTYQGANKLLSLVQNGDESSTNGWRITYGNDTHPATAIQRVQRVSPPGSSSYWSFTYYDFGSSVDTSSPAHAPPRRCLRPI